MVVAVCPYCGHQQQIRATTLGAIKKCVACGEKFRPELGSKHIRSGWRIVFVATVAIIAFWLWVMHTPAPRGRTPPAPVDSPSAAIEPSTPPVPANPASTPVVTGQTVSEKREAALAALRSRPDFIAAKKRADDLSEAVKAARADPERANLPTLSKEWIDAKSAVVKLEAEATHALK